MREPSNVGEDKQFTLGFFTLGLLMQGTNCVRQQKGHQCFKYKIFFKQRFCQTLIFVT